ncbi:MAG: insulinase family protein [Chromatiales bacterium]|jgi:zinc protease|nr:insulinase family protein [Chromatiales bacterium]
MKTKLLASIFALLIIATAPMLVPALISSAQARDGESAQASATTTHEFRLDNGLKLIVREDHRAPVVVSQVWYKVGGSYEHSGITGISHALEHMMFKGTKKHPPGTFSRIIAEHGGRENAFTGRDYTAYFQQLEASRLPISFELEADRMRGLLLPPEEFAREIEVIKEERRLRTDDNPQAITYEQLYATAFNANPYHNPIIGWMNDLEHMTAGDLRKWYDDWYVPDNATLVVVGDVNASEVYSLAKRHYGSVKKDKKHQVPQLKPRTEPTQIGERRVTVRAPARVPYLMLGYKVPVVRGAEVDWEPYALEVLSGVLDGGDSARFSKHLVREEGIAANASASYSPYSRHEDLLMLDGTPAQGHDAAELEAALRQQIAQLRDELITPAELERIKAQVVASDIYQRDSVFYQAMLIGMLETSGLDWRLADEYLEHIKAVTPEQVREVARKYLTDDHLTVAVLEPLPIDPSNPPSAAPAGGANVR